MKTIHLFAPVHHEDEILCAYRKQYGTIKIHHCHKQDGIWRCQHTSCTWRLPSFAIAKQELKVEVSA
jgi:hypothetical protein